MSYPYPQDRHRDRKEKGEQPYEDDREAYAEKQAKIERTAPLPSEEDRHRTQEEQEQEAEERLERIAEERASDAR